MFQELDVVRVVRDFNEHGIKKGSVSTVVCKFSTPALGYELEFTDDDGATIAEFGVLPSDIEGLTS